MNEAVKADFQELEEGDEDVDAVLVGDLGEAFSYPVLNRAFRHLIGGADLSALQKNRYWPLHVVADDRRVGAQAAGLAGILVRTGKFRTAALEASGVTPSAIVDSIADVPGLLGTSR